MNNKKEAKKAFTLVELIVVVVILGILSTIGFVSYVDYMKSARDSNRLQQVTELFDAIQLTATRNKVPLPRKYTSIKFGNNTIGYQGDIDETVLEKIQYVEGGKDPKSYSYFPYFISSDRKAFQLLTYFEDEATKKSQTRSPFSFHRKAEAISYDDDINYEDLFNYDYTSLDPFVYGYELGILIDPNFNAPIHSNYIYEGSTLDLLTSTGTFDSYISNTEIIRGSGIDFIGIIPRTDCLKLKNFLGTNISGVYKINPTGVKPINSYCNMQIDYGGWTLVGRSFPGGIGNFGWNYRYGNVFDDSQLYSMGDSVKNIRFKELLLAVYDSGKNITSAVKLTIDDIFFGTDYSNDSTISPIVGCEVVLTGSLVNPCDPNNTLNASAFSNWGKFQLDGTFWFGHNSSTSGALLSDGFSGSGHLGSGVGDSFDGKQGMIFVR